MAKLELQICAFVLIVCQQIHAHGQVEVHQNERILLIGSESIEQMIKHNYFEAALVSNHPDNQLQVRNLGWAGDTPSAIARGYFNGAQEGYRRLIEEVTRLKPTLILLHYGMNQMDAENPQFLLDYRRLVNDLKSITKRIVILSPLPAEQLPKPLPDVSQLNQIRESLTKQLMDEYEGDGNIDFINMFAPILDEMGQSTQRLTHDTIRFTEHGYELLAKHLLAAFGVEAHPTTPELRELVRVKNDLYFHRYRPQNETYLRGFRKHEQGQNAVEIQQFDELIAEAEQNIVDYLNGDSQTKRSHKISDRELDFDALTPEEQLETFTIDENLQIQLFAGEPQVKNPIHMNFDERGRLWVVSSPIYPQILPGAQPTDEVIILEDQDHDGKADVRLVFANNLLIPTGVLPDFQGGCYVANSTEFLHLTDQDGDGHADQQRVVFSGFGTEDTHHILHTLRWGPDGAIYFNQSVYIHSHIETPHGTQRLLGSGIWRFRPETGQLEVVSRGLVNPWGHVFDPWGQSFATDGAGGEGINYLFPGAAYLTAVGVSKVLHGMNPGQPKHCGLEIISGKHFPETWQDSLITCDFRGNRINHFKLSEQGSGYQSEQQSDFLSSRNRAFRPVDVKQAPDGSVFIADWHNPIINHGEVDFRDPRRDDRHGRIWRVTFKDRPAEKSQDLASLSVSELVNELNNSSLHNRQRARVQLKFSLQGVVIPAIDSMVVDQLEQPENLLEALWTYQSQGVIQPQLINRLLSNQDHRIRAAAVRVLTEWMNPIYQSAYQQHHKGNQLNAMSRLRDMIHDDHPQVRLEVINALRKIESPEAIQIALQALNLPTDQYIDYALWTTFSQQESIWLPAVLSKEINPGNQINQWVFLISTTSNPQVLSPLVSLLKQGKLTPEQQSQVVAILGEKANPNQLQQLFQLTVDHAIETNLGLSALLKAAETRKIKPTGSLLALESLGEFPTTLHLAGLWKIDSFKSRLRKTVNDPQKQQAVRLSAVKGLAAYGDVAALKEIAGNGPGALADQALLGLIAVNYDQALPLIVTRMQSEQWISESIVSAIVRQKRFPGLLAKRLNGLTVNSDRASKMIQSIQSAGAHVKPLVDALRTSSGIQQVDETLTAEQMKTLITQVQQTGDPARGEMIYHRPELACTTCHAIGGAGGVVGPDMVSLGASSPMDYIIESLVEPSAKIKENYHTTTVVTIDGEIITGTLINEGNETLTIRDAKNKPIVINQEDVDDRAISKTSLMPVGLTKKLSRDEFIDLVSFLSMLGKEGKYKISPQQYVRKWVVNGGDPVFSRVDGTFPIENYRGQTVSFAFQVVSPGSFAFQLNDFNHLRITLDDKKDNLRASRVLMDLPVGKHQLNLFITGARKQPLQVELIPVANSSGYAKLINQ